VQLLHGQWREGWSNFESRLTAPSLDSARTFIPPPYPRWRGEPPDGGLLVLFTEQGRGDVIQFARFATVLAAAGHRVAIATQPAYASIFADFAGVERVITDLDDLPACVPLRWEMLVSVAGLSASRRTRFRRRSPTWCRTGNASTRGARGSGRDARSACRGRAVRPSCTTRGARSRSRPLRRSPRLPISD
jgi:hypothetical protein